MTGLPVLSWLQMMTNMTSSQDYDDDGDDDVNDDGYLKQTPFILQ